MNFICQLLLKSNDHEERNMQKYLNHLVFNTVTQECTQRVTPTLLRICCWSKIIWFGSELHRIHMHSHIFKNHLTFYLFHLRRWMLEVNNKRLWQDKKSATRQWDEISLPRGSTNFFLWLRMWGNGALGWSLSNVELTVPFSSILHNRFDTASRILLITTKPMASVRAESRFALSNLRLESHFALSMKNVMYQKIPEIHGPELLKKSDLVATVAPAT